LVETVFFRHVFGFIIGFVVAVDCDMYVVWREVFCSAYFIVPDGRVSFVKFLFCVLVMVKGQNPILTHKHERTVNPKTFPQMTTHSYSPTQHITARRPQYKIHSDQVNSTQQPSKTEENQCRHQVKQDNTRSETPKMQPLTPLTSHVM
jgi:hypothetical protein